MAQRLLFSAPMARSSSLLALVVLCAAAGIGACATGGGVTQPIAANDEEEAEVVPHSGSGGSGGTASEDDCQDGFLNGDEEDVDCGGSCAPCCEPTTYDKTSGLGSGTMTVCCDDGDTLAAVSDCGVGDNHGANADGACGVGFEGAMNNGSACVTITCETGCFGDDASSSSSTAGSSTSASSGSGAGGADPSGCAHDACETGDALDPTCDSCVGAVCSEDSYCCNTAQGAWDEACVGLVATVCGETC